MMGGMHNALDKGFVMGVRYAHTCILRGAHTYPPGRFHDECRLLISGVENTNEYFYIWSAGFDRGVESVREEEHTHNPTYIQTPQKRRKVCVIKERKEEGEVISI